MDWGRTGHKILERLTSPPGGRRPEYADVRLIRTQRRELQLKNGKLAGHIDHLSTGYGIRVLDEGFWGFSSDHRWDETSIDRAIAQAMELARIARLAARGDKGQVARLTPGKAHEGKWVSPCARDPFEVPVAEQLEMLRNWDERLRRVNGVAITTAQMAFRRDHKLFLSTEHSLIEQTLVTSGMGYSAVAVSADDAQIRSYPSSAGGQFALRGYELLEEFPFAEEAERVGEEAVALLSAPQCPAGVRDIILDSSQLALQIHESCGHPSELDRVLGWEANYAGRSFLTPDKLGFKYGSPLVTITADSTSPGGLGTFAFDDEGQPARSWKIVDAGTFVGYLTSRETAAAIGERESHATMRADGWNRAPLIRMVNVSLEPGDWTLEDLLADTEGGLYLETNRSWSIDQLRYNFQFGTEAAWEIRGGKKGRLLKNPTYQGITPDFWKSCDAICNRDNWTLWGVPNCGKGEPGQVMGTGHGAAPARFRNVRVGIGYEAAT